jgi:hypothetical protein
MSFFKVVKGNLLVLILLRTGHDQTGSETSDTLDRGRLTATRRASQGMVQMRTSA